MDKYKINYIFNEDNNINDVLINVLNKKLKKYIQMIGKEKQKESSSLCNYLSLERDKHC